MKNKLQLIRQIIKEETSKFIKKKKLLEEKSILIKKLKRLDENYEEDFIDKVHRRFEEEYNKLQWSSAGGSGASEIKRKMADSVSYKLAEEFNCSYDDIVNALNDYDEMQMAYASDAGRDENDDYFDRGDMHEGEPDDDDDYEPDYEDYDDRDDDHDSGMSSSQQGHADRSDYAREKMERGDWDEEQAAEFRAGA